MSKPHVTKGGWVLRRELRGAWYLLEVPPGLPCLSLLRLPTGALLSLPPNLSHMSFSLALMSGAGSRCWKEALASNFR